MDKKSLSERDVCIKFITPALRQAGWDEMAQIREEVSFTNGRIIVRGKLVTVVIDYSAAEPFIFAGRPSMRLVLAIGANIVILLHPIIDLKSR
jgi:type I site-specific restriction endonuclease